MSSPEMYDVEAALKALARTRRRNDQLTRGQVELADMLATNLTKHFPHDGGLEDAGTALVTAAASVGALAAKGLSAQVIVNVLAFAGQRMVLDGRAAEAAAVGTTCGAECASVPADQCCAVIAAEAEAGAPSPTPAAS